MSACSATIFLLQTLMFSMFPWQVSGLCLEGCSFDGNRLSENQHDSPSVSSVLPCFMGWIPQVIYFLVGTSFKLIHSWIFFLFSLR